jgi:hypothetical protein
MFYCLSRILPGHPDKTGDRIEGSFYEVPLPDPTTIEAVSYAPHGVAGVLFFVSCALGRHLLKKEQEIKDKDKEKEELWKARREDQAAHSKNVEAILTRQVEKDEKSATLHAEVRGALDRVAVLVERHLGGE